MEHTHLATRRGKATRPPSRKNRCAHGAKMSVASEASIVVAPAVEVVETYFGLDGRPVKRKSSGAARVARRYDARGNQIEEAYYNTEGKPTADRASGAARIAWRYDDSGNQIEAAFYDAAGERMRRAR